jgi:hypothetical protein
VRITRIYVFGSWNGGNPFVTSLRRQKGLQRPSTRAACARFAYPAAVERVISAPDKPIAAYGWPKRNREENAPFARRTRVEYLEVVGCCG